MKLNECTALVTGGATGLGFSIAKKLVAKSCRTHIVSRKQEKLTSAQQKVDSPLLKTHAGDVTNYSSIKQLVTEIGQIDILINNAGVWLQGQLADQDEAQIANVIDVNLKGVIFAAKAVLPAMLERNQGYILNVSSTSGLKARHNEAVYVASKFGVTGFTKSLNQDLANTNVKVAGFYPGGMNTDFFAKAGFPKDNQDWLDTDKVAEIVVFMLEQDDTMIMNQVEVDKRKSL